jgi:hypothetical protein
MTEMNWDAPSRLLERDDSGSDMYVEFKERDIGPLSALIGQVAVLPATERARLVIDAGAQGMFNMGDIMALSERADYPQG